MLLKLFRYFINDIQGRHMKKALAKMSLEQVEIYKLGFNDAIKLIEEFLKVQDEERNYFKTK